MPEEPKKVTRKTLAKYAGLLGRNSPTYTCLRDYDEAVAAGRKPRIEMLNNGFRIVVTDLSGPNGEPVTRRYRANGVQA